ncbi:MAG: VanZ family protein [Lachnospiraceae bacterium]|nr:VanZ family protein [Lachnospiraceae bacterium]
MFFIEIILINACAGFLSVLPFFIVLEIFFRKQIPYLSLKHLVGDGILGIYLAAVLAIAGVPGLYELELTPNMNLLPFVDLTTNPLHYFENMLLFLPIGFLLPALYPRCQSLKNCILPGFCFSLSIELLQIFSFRATDVDDLIMNTAGCAAGYGIFWLIHKLYPAAASDFTAFPEEGDAEAYLAAQNEVTRQPYMKQKLPRLFNAEAFVFMIASWAGALLLTPVFKAIIWNIFS